VYLPPADNSRVGPPLPGTRWKRSAGNRRDYRRSVTGKEARAKEGVLLCAEGTGAVGRLRAFVEDAQPW
jgi:hypothetical protein